MENLITKTNQTNQTNMGVADYITKLEKQNEYFKKQLRTKIQDKIELKKENEKLKEKN